MLHPVEGVKFVFLCAYFCTFSPQLNNFAQSLPRSIESCKTFPMLTPSHTKDKKAASPSLPTIFYQRNYILFPQFDKFSPLWHSFTIILIITREAGQSLLLWFLFHGIASYMLTINFAWTHHHPDLYHAGLFYPYFYRTRVRSLAMLVTHSLTDWLTHSLTP